MTDGDMTVIQHNSLNLSGGQKVRIGLARALYAKTDIILIDNSMSSLDVIVAESIFNNL